MKKKFSILLVSMLFLVLNVSVSTSAYTNSNWMGSLADNKSLADLSIPGTHDSGARYEPVSGTAKCQDLDISSQLDIGVRYLDIRCRHLNNAFSIHHGSIYQHLNYDDVINSCLNFLNSNPSECIIMSVKEEYESSNNNRSFEQTFDSYIAKNPNRWYLGSTTPTLGQARGKIILLRRFSSNSLPKGISATKWGDNTTFTMNNGQVKVQDQYKVKNNDSKWNAIEDIYKEVQAQNNKCLFINYASGYKSLIFSIPSITSVSNNINTRLVSYFNKNTKGKFGITAMDFVNSDMSSKIISTNF